jgi:hypothetical protein
MKDIGAVKKLIENKVSLGAILKSDVSLSLDIDEIQLSCPFHGVDAQKSARFYRDTDSMYCWVCKKSWDIYGYVGQREVMNFNQTVNYLVKTFHVDISKAPDAFTGGETSPLFTRKRVEVDRKALAIAKIKTHLVLLKTKIAPEKYIRIVFAFMLLKYNTPEERFRDDSNKLAHLIVKLNRG